MNDRAYIIECILQFMELDIDEARASLKRQHEWQPWLDLMNGVKAALKDEK